MAAALRVLAAGVAAGSVAGCGGKPDAPPDCVTTPVAPVSPTPTSPLTSTIQGSRPARGARSAPGTDVLQPIAQLPLPGPALRFDYQSVDTAMNRLYISHMGAGELVVFDLQANQVIDTVGGLPELTGVLAVPALGKVYASVTGAHTVAIINDTTLQLVADVGSIGFPDGIAYAPDQRKIYVSDEAGGGELVIDGPSNSVVTAIPIGGKAGNTVYDAGSHCILVAVQTANQIVAIDPRSDRVIGRYNPPGAAYPHGLLVDAPHHLLFVANLFTAVLSIVDLQTMSLLGNQPVGAGPDVLAFDPGWRRLYVASESGVVSVFTEVGTSLIHEGDVTMAHAHTVAVDPRSHLSYFPLQDVGGQPILLIMAGTPPASAGREDERSLAIR